LFALLATTISMTAGTAMADSIKGRVGVTGKIGFLNPADNHSDFLHNKTDEGFIAGGSIIYGFDNHLAGEIDVSRTSFGSETGDFGVTNVSLGVQYRFALSHRPLVPFIGAGMDILMSDYNPHSGVNRDVDTTVGAHINGGVDYFLQKQLAITAEVKVVGAPDTGIYDRFGDHVGDFNPSSVSTTVGFRCFFN
jgi:outer membrane protein